MILKNLKAVRLDRALSMHELTRLSGVSTTTIVRAERGGTMYLATVRKLAKALGVTPSELRGDDQQQPTPRRAATAPPTTLPVASPLDAALDRAHALAEADWARRDGDLAGAARWEQIARGIAGSVE